MVQDNQQAPPAAAETPPPGAPDESSNDDEPVDWEARAKTAETARDEAQHALSSERGRQNGREAEQENYRLESENRRRITDRKIDALADRLGSGETESLPSDLSTIQRDSDTLDASSDYNRAYLALSNEWREMVVDKEGKQILSLDSDDFANARDLWTRAQTASDVQGLQAAINEASRAVRGHLLTTRTVTTETAREAGRADAEGKGAFNLSTGAEPVGGQGETDLAWLTRVYADDSIILTAEQNLRAKKILDNL